MTYEPSLDGMRGLCIAAVVLFHVCAVSGLDGWFRGGFIGVSVFFTLSGFLITSLLLREHGDTGTIRLRTFWARRIRRLWPASLLVVLAVVVLSAAGTLSARTSDAVAATWNVTKWHVIAGGEEHLLQTIVGPLGPTWSLAVEEQFYIVLALLLVLAIRSRNTHAVLAVVSVVGIVVPLILSNSISDWQPTLEFHTVLRMPELFAGVLLAVWMRSGRAPRPGVGVADAMAASGAAVLVGLFLFADYTPPWLLRGGYSLVAVTTVAIIVGLLQHGHVARLFGAVPLRPLGLISYSLYLVHWPIVSVLSAHRGGLDGVSLMLVMLTVSLLVAVVLHLAVERPIRRMATPDLPTIAAGFGAVGAVTLTSLILL
ncbi:MAG: acyltransferase [Actinobacteria bacterium]|nr:acyltransferase [Actinomycetota bacterium]